MDINTQKKITEDHIAAVLQQLRRAGHADRREDIAMLRGSLFVLTFRGTTLGRAKRNATKAYFLCFFAAHSLQFRRYRSERDMVAPTDQPDPKKHHQKPGGGVPCATWCDALMDINPLGVLVITMSGTVLMVNKKATQLLRIQQADLLNKPLFETVPALWTRLENGSQRYATGELLEGRIEFAPASAPDSRESPAALAFKCKVIGSNLLVNEPQPVCCLTLAPAEDERVVREERDRLLKMASVGEVLPAILHEIKNPLAAVTTTIEIMLEETEEPITQRDLHAVLSNLRRIRMTLDGVGVTGQRLRSARYSAVDHAIREACLVLTHRATELGIHVQDNIVSFPLLPFEPSVIAAIVFNLMMNAIQACTKGNTIEVTAALKNEELRIVIKDTGAGMNATTLARCKEVFFTTKPKGIGVGLALCDQLVREAGGLLSIESALGVGTTIEIFLPIPPPLSTL